jgi:hypothetical protein
VDLLEWLVGDYQSGLTPNGTTIGMVITLEIEPGSSIKKAYTYMLFSDSNSFLLYINISTTN